MHKNCELQQWLASPEYALSVFEFTGGLIMLMIELILWSRLSEASSN